MVAHVGPAAKMLAAEGDVSLVLPQVDIRMPGE